MNRVYSFPHGIVGITAQAEELFQRLTQLPVISEKLARQERLAGGYVTIARPDGLPLATFGLGRVVLEKAADCHAFSLEKAHRLGGYAAAPHCHRLSRESRDEEKKQYAGAVCGSRFITSFSGLPEDGDELYSALLQCRIGGMSVNNMHTLLALQPNTWLFNLDSIFGDLAKA
ncbi:MAG: hypothetical protein JWO84_25 [Parcubacteria group bacterium]|nr:hypothetical protein [Parcubacteria group bacterium]